MSPCVITIEGKNYNFPQPTCFASPPQMLIVKSLLSSTIRTSLPKTHNLTFQEPERSHKMPLQSSYSWLKGHALRTPRTPIVSSVLWLVLLISKLTDQTQEVSVWRQIKDTWKRRDILYVVKCQSTWWRQQMLKRRYTKEMRRNV